MSTMTAEGTQTDAVAEQTTTRVAVLLAAWEAGRIATPDLARGSAVATFTGKIIASRLADIYVSMLADKRPVGIRPSDLHLDRLTNAADVILLTPQEASESLLRLAVAEVHESAQLSAVAAIREQGFSHYVERNSPGACPICEPYDGLVHNVGEGWEPHHPRCRCVIEPTQGELS